MIDENGHTTNPQDLVVNGAHGRLIVPRSLIGKKFGKLTVTKLARDSRGRAVQVCDCVCGVEIYVTADKLENKSRTQCSDCAALSRRGEPGFSRQMGISSAALKSIHPVNHGIKPDPFRIAV